MWPSATVNKRELLTNTPTRTLNETYIASLPNLSQRRFSPFLRCFLISIMVVGKLGKRVMDSFIQKNGKSTSLRTSANERAKGITDGMDSVTSLEEPEFATNIQDPGDRDILLGRGRTSWGHTGNQEFRSFVGAYLKTYTESKNRNEKTNTVHLIYDEIIKSGGRFLKHDSATNTWFQVGRNVAREKIAHALRDAIGLRIKVTSTDGDDSLDGPRFAGGSAMPSVAVEQTSAHDLFLADGSAGKKAPPREDVLPSRKHTRKTKLPKIVKPNDQTSKSADKAGRDRKKSPKEPEHPEGQELLKVDTFTTPEAFDDVEGELQRRGEEKSFHHLVDFMLTEVVQPKDNSHLVDELDQTSTTTSMYDEFSSGFSTMSLETPISGSGSRSIGDRKEGKSAISQLSDMVNVVRSSRARQSIRSGNFVGARNLVSYDRDSAQLEMSIQERRQECTHSHFQGEALHDSDCDVSMGGTSVEWTKGASFCDAGDVVSLDDFSLASNRSRRKPRPNDQSMDSSSKSTETEKEWRRTLKALRGT